MRWPLATGNDWRALEAGAHAWAARHGNYTALSKWWSNGDGALCGRAGDADQGGHGGRLAGKPTRATRLFPADECR